MPSKESKTEDVKFFNAQDGIRGRDGGPYADQEDARQREIARARAEGREPDLDNPPPFVGNQVVTSRFVEDNLYSNPSMFNAPGPAEAYEEAKSVKDSPHLVEVGSLPVDKRTSVPDSERKEQQKAINELAQDPANVATTGADSVAEGDNSAGDNSDRAGQPTKSDTTSKPAATVKK